MVWFTCEGSPCTMCHLRTIKLLVFIVAGDLHFLMLNHPQDDFTVGGLKFGFQFHSIHWLWLWKLKGIIRNTQMVQRMSGLSTSNCLVKVCKLPCIYQYVMPNRWWDLSSVHQPVYHQHLIFNVKMFFRGICGLFRSQPSFSLLVEPCITANRELLTPYLPSKLPPYRNAEPPRHEMS